MKHIARGLSRRPTLQCIEVIPRISISLSAILPTHPQFLSSQCRAFSVTSLQQSWLLPTSGYKRKVAKGRPHVATGGSVRGTTVVWGDYGLRMCDHHRRVSATQLKIGEDAIKRRLRGERYRFYTRIAANVPVFTSGNETRMGKGKGSFDHWASRIPLNRIIFEIKGDLHEQVVRDAFRLAGAKMPGLYEFVKKGDPPVMGMTKMVPGITKEDLFRPRRKKTPVSEKITPELLSDEKIQPLGQSTA